MEDSPRKFCPALWFSGFFGLGALGHLVRLLVGFPVTIGTWQVPLRFSALAAVVFGALSLGLLYVACRRPCCAKE